MKIPPIRRRLLLMLGFLIPLAAVFVITLLRTGPLAAVPVSVVTIQQEALVPVLYGIGTVEARWRYQIGPTHTGRLASLEVDVGDSVPAGLSLGNMDPIDLDELMIAQDSSVMALESAIAMADARLTDANARRTYTQSQYKRYLSLLESRSVSQDALEVATQNDEAAAAAVHSATAAVELAKREHIAARAKLEALAHQKDELTLRAPVAGLIVERRIEPGSTAVAGETVLEMIDPRSLWIHLRLNQLDAAGLRAGLPCHIELRSRPGELIPGRILRVEPLADAVTEEMLAKVVFEKTPDPLPPLGELAEVHVALPAEPATTVLPAAAIQSYQNRQGIWIIIDEKPSFTPVRTGRRSADGIIQILSGLENVNADAQVIVHSQRPITPRSRLEIQPRESNNNQP